MTRVREAFAQLERQCLGLNVPCRQCLQNAQYCEWPPDRLDVQYEVAGPGGGIWHLAIHADDCELREGPTTHPGVTVRASVDDWLALWSGREPVEALLASRRISVASEDASATEDDSLLLYLGVLGPLRELEGSAAENAPQYMDGPGDSPSHYFVEEWWPSNLRYEQVRWIDRDQLFTLAQSEWGDEFRSILRRATFVPRWLRNVLSRLEGDGHTNSNPDTVALRTAEVVRLISRAQQQPRFFRFLVESRIIAPDRRL